MQNHPTAERLILVIFGPHRALCQSGLEAGKLVRTKKLMSLEPALVQAKAFAHALVEPAGWPALLLGPIAASSWASSARYHLPPLLDSHLPDLCASLPVPSPGQAQDIWQLCDDTTGTVRYNTAIPRPLTAFSGLLARLLHMIHHTMSIALRSLTSLLASSNENPDRGFDQTGRAACLFAFHGSHALLLTPSLLFVTVGS
ncbi:hypothetical protein VTN96DRAFT_1266 [Rasamsonia emersonii]